ncbi:MAG TPA: 23S rRNA (guanosine(2251)-2'-O)-methyltransferase RlmB, partial [Caldilineaceae bacterium]|nr:23S rRNA (guanosine(2251)-2'-O)-methyltransferase RlmB [Caldilineaceae bacterium]
MSELLAGRQAVREALRANRRRIYRLWLASGDMDKTGITGEIIALAEARNIPVKPVNGTLFETLSEQRVNHQGVALETDGYPYANLDTILRAKSDTPLLLILDHIQDPQNLGTLIRTAEAVGVDGLLLPDRRAAGVTPAVSNASAGAVEHLPVAQVTNLNRTIDQLKKQGVWVVGLDSGDDAIPLDKADLTGPLALVVGNESSGISRLTREKCDFIVHLPMVGQVESLNAAVAGSFGVPLKLVTG